jgi:hypothetical protein
MAVDKFLETFDNRRIDIFLIFTVGEGEKNRLHFFGSKQIGGGK